MTEPLSGYAQGLVRSGLHPEIAIAASRVQENLERLGVDRANLPPRIKAYLKTCGVVGIMYLSVKQMNALAAKLESIQSIDELKQVPQESKLTHATNS